MDRNRGITDLYLSVGKKVVEKVTGDLSKFLDR